MKYKVIDYVSNVEEVEFGTCELCFHTGYAEQGHLVIEDELGKKENIPLYEWDWGDCYEIYIDNVIDFSHWLSQRDEPPLEEIDNLFSWLSNLVSDYHEEKRKNKLKHYKLKIIFTNRETFDELVDEETIRDLLELYEYTKDKEFLFVSFKIKGIEINVKDIDKLYCTEC
jgi:hypothetical protein